jgi:hypothetical protein
MSTPTERAFAASPLQSARRTLEIEARLPLSPFALESFPRWN